MTETILPRLAKIEDLGWSVFLICRIPKVDGGKAWRVCIHRPQDTTKGLWRAEERAEHADLAVALDSVIFGAEQKRNVTGENKAVLEGLAFDELAATLRELERLQIDFAATLGR